MAKTTARERWAGLSEKEREFAAMVLIWFGTNAAAAHGVRQEAITAALAVLREACGEALKQ